MRLRKPDLKDNLPTLLCLLCNRPFCVDHKGEKDGVCEINHETYYRKHPAAQKYLHRTYEDYERDYEEMMIDEMSGDERKAMARRRKENGGKAEVGAVKEDGKRMDEAQK
jgi:hypothetical protein